MATDPSFAATPRVSAAIPGTAETSLTVPAQSVTVLTPGAQGSMISSIKVEAVAASLVPATVAGLVYVFLYDGTTYNLYDTIAITAVTASTTVAPFSVRVPYTDLVVPAGWSLKASQSIAGNASVLKVTALGGDF